MRAPLDLSSATPVAIGVQRAVYLHPHDPTKLIKVLRREEDRPKRNDFNGIMDRLLPSTRLRQIRKEYTEYLRVMLRNHGPDFHPPISHMFGFVQTSEGLGCLTERVKEPDGSLGQTLRAKVKSAPLPPEDLTLLNDAIRRFYKHDIRAGDMNGANFVFGHRDTATGPGPRECVLVDGFGDIHAIPVRSLGRWANQLGLQDSCKRLAVRTGLRWDANTRQFHLT